MTVLGKETQSKSHQKLKLEAILKTGIFLCSDGSLEKSFIHWDCRQSYKKRCELLWIVADDEQLSIGSGFTLVTR